MGIAALLNMDLGKSYSGDSRYTEHGPWKELVGIAALLNMDLGKSYSGDSRSTEHGPWKEL